MNYTALFILVMILSIPVLIVGLTRLIHARDRRLAALSTVRKSPVSCPTTDELNNIMGRSYTAPLANRQTWHISREPEPDNRRRTEEDYSDVGLPLVIYEMANPSPEPAAPAESKKKEASPLGHSRSHLPSLYRCGRILMGVANVGPTGGGSPMFRCADCGVGSAAMGPECICWCGMTFRGGSHTPYRCASKKEHPEWEEEFQASGCWETKSEVGIVTEVGIRRLVKAQEYQERNPLGGPAVTFYAMAERVRAGEDFYAVLEDCGFQEKDLLARHRDRSQKRVQDLVNKKMAPAEIEASTDGWLLAGRIRFLFETIDARNPPEMTVEEIEEIKLLQKRLEELGGA